MMLSRLLGVVGLTIGAAALGLVVLALITVGVVAVFPNAILLLAHN